MNFKAYDILSSLVPGFLATLVLLDFLGMKYDKDLVIAYTAVAFLLGFVMNTVGSWMEEIYFWTWGGKPSNRLLQGHSIWKVKFYHSGAVRAKLIAESSNQNASDDELFSIAMRHVNGKKDTRIEDFNTSYAFSRTLLTTVLYGTGLLLYQNYFDYRYYLVLLPILFVVWLRSKQRGYYYSREVLNEYLKV